MSGNNAAGSSDSSAGPGRLPFCGVLLVDKPAGPTSHDMVARLRRISGIRKVGHAGTLDPFATGLMLMLMGKATRLFDLLSILQKTYRFTMQFGALSTTGDTDGELTPVAGNVNEEGLREVLPEFTGEICQRPPAYSAIKIDGEPLYRKARRGEDAVAPERQVQVHRLTLLSFDEERQKAELEVVCSRGTYIRSLCQDIAARLGAGAYTSALRRTGIGNFDVGDALGQERLEATPPGALTIPDNPSFISCMGALYFLPVREVDANEARMVMTGRQIQGEAEGPVRVARAGELLALYGPAASPGFLKPLVVLS